MDALTVKLTVGFDEAAERFSQGLTVAATALAAGARVSLWLTGEAVWLALPGRAEGWHLAKSAEPAALRDSLIVEGTVTVCTQCAARRGLSEADLLPGVRIAGAAAFVEEALTDGTQALVY